MEQASLPKDNKGFDKLVFGWVAAVSIFVFLLVLVLNKKIIPGPETPPAFAYYLPMLNAFINGSCSIILLISLYQIKRKNIAMHRKLNLLAFGLSAIFLISYVMFHYFVKETTFGGSGTVKYIYYFILISHIILAALVLPLVLISFYFGLSNNVAKHRRLTRWSYPIWLYVTITGVVVYLMIAPYYKF
jgi:putative membrane protein